VAEHAYWASYGDSDALEDVTDDDDD